VALSYDRYFDPGAARLALTLAGVEAPEIAAGCEIGAGGLSSLIVAAAYPGADWRAVFTDPDRSAEVDDLAERAGLGLTVSAGIEAFAARNDLPMFDFVGVTPNWSLLGATAQAAVLDLLARRLRPGGVFYASCLVQPGSLEDAPLQTLGRTLLRGATPEEPDFPARFAAMLDEAEAALASAPRMLARHTDYLGLLADLRGNSDPAAMWRRWFDPRCKPTTFLDHAARMKATGLEFVASAELANYAPEVNFTPRQRMLLAAEEDPVTREQMSDLISYTWGRSDYWVKAPRPMGAEARAAALAEARLTLTRPAAEFEFRIKGMLGHVSLRREVYGPLLAAIEARPDLRLVDLPADPSTVTEAAALFISAGAARATWGSGEGVGDACRRLNRVLFEDALCGRSAAACAAPALRGGVEASPTVMRFLAAWAGGARDAESLTRICAGIEAAFGRADAIEELRIGRDARDFIVDAEVYERLGVL
jgi:SAM-dependent methyltransferase